jgi:hypothetical protein
MVLLLILLASFSALQALPAMSNGTSGSGRILSAFPMEDKTLEISAAGSIYTGNAVQLRTITNPDSIIKSPGAVRQDYAFALNLGAFRFLELGLHFPFFVDDNGKGSSTSGTGDLSISAKFNYPPYPHKQGFALSYFLQLSAPTSMGGNGKGFTRHAWGVRPLQPINGQDRYQINNFGSTGAVLQARLLTTANFGVIEGMFPLKLHINGGLALSDVNSRNAFLFGTGLELTPVEYITFFTALDAEVMLDNATQSVPLFSHPMRSSFGIQGNVAKLKLSAGMDFMVNARKDVWYQATSEFVNSIYPLYGFFFGISGVIDFKENFF